MRKSTRRANEGDCRAKIGPDGADPARLSGTAPRQSVARGGTIRPGRKTSRCAEFEQNPLDFPRRPCYSSRHRKDTRFPWAGYLVSTTKDRSSTWSRSRSSRTSGSFPESSPRMTRQATTAILSRRPSIRPFRGSSETSPESGAASRRSSASQSCRTTSTCCSRSKTRRIGWRWGNTCTRSRRRWRGNTGAGRDRPLQHSPGR